MGAAAMRGWLSKHDGLGGVTAIFCAADNLALGVISALQEAKFILPDDVSVVGFDGVALGEFTSPTLTTVSVPLDYIGLAALNLLEQRIVAADAAMPANRLELGCRLTIRGSVRTLV